MKRLVLLLIGLALAVYIGRLAVHFIYDLAATFHALASIGG